MRFVTKLLKMNLDAKSIKMEGEQLVLRGQSGSLEGVVYLRPKEIVEMARLSLNASTITFILFFPFFYLMDYLVENDGDERQRIYSIVRVASLVLASILLVAGFPYLARYPAQSALLLAVFAVLFLVTFITSRINTLFYSFIILGVAAYYLVVLSLGIADHVYPMLAIPILLIIYFAAKQFTVSQRLDVSQLLRNSAYLLTLFFGGYIAWNTPGYVEAVPWEAALPLLVFAVLYFATYRENRGLRHQYLALLFLASGYLFLLYSLAPLPRPYYGAALGALGIALAVLGSRHRRASDLAHAAPLWVAAAALPMIGLAFSVVDQTALLLSLLMLAISAYIACRSADASKAPTYSEDWWFATPFFALTNLVALIVVFELFEFSPASLGAMATALGLAVLYHQMGRDRESTFLRSRNVYLYISTFFLTTFCLLVLVAIDPFKQMQLNAPLLLLPSLGVLAYAYSREGRGQSKEATTLYESSYLVMAAALALPILTRSYSASISSAVAVGFLLLYFGLMMRSRNEGLIYSPVIVGAFLYYNALAALNVPSPFVAVLFAVVGIVAMAGALKLNDSQRTAGKMLYFAWFLFSGLSALSVARDVTLVNYVLTFWAIAYVVAARFISEASDNPPFYRNPTKGLRNSIELVGTLGALAALLLLLSHQSMVVAVIVTAALGLAYLAVVLLTKDAIYLYPASLLVSAAYLLSLKPIATYDDGLLFMLPPLLALYGSGHYFWSKGRRGIRTPLAIAGVLAAMAAGWLVIYYQDLVTMPPLVVASFLLYAALDVALARAQRERWYLLPSLIFFAVALYFATDMVGGLPFETRLAILAPLGIVYAALAGFVKRRGAELWAQPIFAATVLVALAISAATFISGGKPEAQLATVVSAVAFVLVHFLLGKHEFIYLIVLSLGLLAYHFLLASVDPFSRDLVQYFIIGLILSGLFFLVPPALRAVGYTKKLSELVIDNRGWAFAIAVPIFIAVPLLAAEYTVTATSNPSFCASCHSMKGYYDTWQKSAHVQKANPPVGCDTCHYPPGGPETVFQGRFTGLLMTLDELGNFQPSKFHARVTDANCLQEGCHSKPKLNKWVLFKGVKFNHEPMISQNVRGLELNCTTCHARVKESTEKHFEVNESVCYNCHLLGRKTTQGTAVGTCYTCHDSSIQTKVKAGYVTVGGLAGSRVEETRCLSCHANSNKIEDQQLMHSAHINDVKVFRGRKVECFECHSEIKHGNLGSSSP